MRIKTKLLVGGIATVLVAMLILGLALGMAQGQTEDTQSENTSVQSTAERTTLLSRVAKILGIEEEKLSDAFTQARIQMIDGLVEEGWLGESQAQLMKERIESGLHRTCRSTRGIGRSGGRRSIGRLGRASTRGAAPSSNPEAIE